MTDSEFKEWETRVFGYGYGTGERHVIAALKRFMEVLPCKDVYDYVELEKACGAATAWLLINALCRSGDIEYGCSPRFGWLTPAGKRLQAHVNARSAEMLESQLID